MEDVIRDWQLCVDDERKSYLQNVSENKHFLKLTISVMIQLQQCLDVSRRFEGKGLLI